MKKISVIIEGKEYPCFITMGAFLDFKNETGREAQAVMGAGDLTDILTWLWACTRSACRREGIEFGMSLVEFADRITPETLADWSLSVMEENKEKATEEGAKKKKPRKS